MRDQSEPALSTAWNKLPDAVQTRNVLLQVLRHSRLYESAAAYVTDQPAFLNAAIAVHTNLAPKELLSALKSIEVRSASCLPHAS